ncbi:hypothetical protein DPX16_8326 [Anabarilius grahami]|uniref:Uncharacterized protein n=1 Tax=Anabarilius grahami TaxID=495550 RepID=A0A3N0ZBW6_ANAGA|nr:hypothetical protein DPX16_8326 [Anabarilius grahami]
MIKSRRFMDAEEVEALNAMSDGESDGGHSPLLSAALQPSLHSSSPITTEPAVNAQASKQAGPPMTADKQLWHIHWYGRNINNMIYIDYGLLIL